MAQQERLMMFSLNMVDYPIPHVLPLAVHLYFFWLTGRGDHFKALSLCLKVSAPAPFRTIYFVVGNWGLDGAWPREFWD